MAARCGSSAQLQHLLSVSLLHAHFGSQIHFQQALHASGAAEELDSSPAALWSKASGSRLETSPSLALLVIDILDMSMRDPQ